jgi:hypothetical protein
MRKLILLLLAFLAVFTYIRALDTPEIQDSSMLINAEVSVELPVEILR